jgi:hypothetical protein
MEAFGRRHGISSDVSVKLSLLTQQPDMASQTKHR